METERLVLRPFRESDLEDFFDCCHNPNIGKNAGWKPHDTIEESKEVLTNVFLGNKDMLAIVLKEDDRVIGSIGIIEDSTRQNPKAGMIGFWLKESFWSKGFVSEAVKALLAYAFNTQGLDLISGRCYPHNARSRNTLERNGFAYEGMIHQAELTYDGLIYDHFCFYITKEMFTAEK